MPIPNRLDHVLLSYRCPHCGELIEQRGGWFRLSGQFHCPRCEHAIRVTYDARDSAAHRSDFSRFRLELARMHSTARHQPGSKDPLPQGEETRRGEPSLETA